MSRSVCKISYYNFSFMYDFVMGKTSDVVKNLHRSSTINEELVGKKILIYNGKRFSTILVTKFMVGCKVGEFQRTRFFRKHTTKTKKGKKGKK